MRQTSRQKLYGFLNWAVQRGHLKPIYSPPASLPETLKPKRVGYPLEDGQILALLDSLPQLCHRNQYQYLESLVQHCSKQ
jgi:hypothetical protein